METLNTTTITPHEKAVQINLDKRFYGTFAEIGAGQEVARWFFRVGGASGTLAKTISAYDMAFSDAIYGKGERYVSLPRLMNMLELRVQAADGAPGRKAGRADLLLRFCRYGFRAELSRHERVSRLDGREVPASATGRAERNHSFTSTCSTRRTCSSRKRSAPSA